MNTPKTEFETAGNGHLIPSLSLPNQYKDDHILQSVLTRLLSSDGHQSIKPDLIRLGHLSATKYLDLANEQESNPPRLQKYDAFGHSINTLVTCSAWKQQHDIAAHEGVVALGYRSNEYSAKMAPKYWRIYQFAKLLIWQQSSGLFDCPIAMTDGAAKLLSIICSENGQSPTSQIRSDFSFDQQRVLQSAYYHLTSMEKDHFWTSGQWMTERGGGSDVTVNGTNTVAKQQGMNLDEYRLWGYKWFSSATDANISIALARIEDYDGDTVVSGNKGVSCFLVPDVKKNNVEIVQLKHKLGTRQLPTAELQLKGTRGVLELRYFCIFEVPNMFCVETSCLKM